MKVRTGNYSDIPALLKLEYRIFPKQWHIPAEFPCEMLAKNKKVLRVVEEDGELKGHYYFLPLPQDIYEKVLQGKLDEKEIADYIQSDPLKDDIYLYLMCIIVDTESANRHQYANLLVKDISGYLEEYRRNGITIQEIGGIFISKGGIKVASQLGMIKTGQIQYADGIKYPIYRTSREKL